MSLPCSSAMHDNICPPSCFHMSSVYIRETAREGKYVFTCLSLTHANWYARTRLTKTVRWEKHDSHSWKRVRKIAPGKDLSWAGFFCDTPRTWGLEVDDAVFGISSRKAFFSSRLVTDLTTQSSRKLPRNQHCFYTVSTTMRVCVCDGENEHGLWPQQVYENMDTSLWRR